MVEPGSLNVTQAVEKILIIGPSWVGDMVMAQSLFITLKNRFPNCLIDVLAPSWSLALLERMPQVNLALAMPLSHGQFAFLARLRLGQKLRSHGYQQAIVLPNSWKSALIPFFAGIPLRTGYVGEARWGLLNVARALDKVKLTKTVERFVALGLAEDAKLPPTYEFPHLRVSAEQQSAVSAKFALKPGQPILALCPGAEYGPAKQWPCKQFAELAKIKHSQGWQVWLFGSGKDSEIAEQINQLSGGICQDFTGKTSLGEAVDLLSLVSVVVSNDSGLMHVAAALDKKLIALYGSSDPQFTPPLQQNAAIISLNLDCSPCFKRICPLGHTRCLTDISAQTVIAAIDS